MCGVTPGEALEAGVEPMAAPGGDGAPLVSCLMVALPAPARLAGLRRSLAAYRAQTWAPRELVVVLDQGPTEARAAIRQAVDEVQRGDIRIVEPPGPLSLGALRNLSWLQAGGEIVCIWDDDDLHHPERLSRQVEILRASGGLSTALSEVMQYFPASRRLYLTNWAATPLGIKPASLMCVKAAPARYPETGPQSRVGEDLAMLTELKRLGGVRGVAGAAHLYVYVSHAINTCGGDHHRMLADRLSISQALLRRREPQLREGLTPFEFGAGEVVVEGRNGPAFSLDGRGAWD
jgi:glycosyltransferase involved in cell wall biosynthesis